MKKIKTVQTSKNNNVDDARPWNSASSQTSVGKPDLEEVDINTLPDVCLRNCIQPTVDGYAKAVDIECLRSGKLFMIGYGQLLKNVVLNSILSPNDQIVLMKYLGNSTLHMLTGWGDKRRELEQ